jgi:phosphoglycerate dehydrogenase-like enzyme
MADQLLDRTKGLRFIQSIGAGTDQFPREELAGRGIRLASARGVNARAVAEHAMALMLALSRRLPEARDNQRARIWRGMIGDLSQREDELGGKTLLVVGLGDIGGRLAQLAKAFDMHVVGLRRHPGFGRGAAEAVHAMDIPGSSQSNRDRAELVALRRLRTVEDCAKVVEFLATDLSDYVTGAVIPIDGGLVRG